MRAEQLGDTGQKRLELVRDETRETIRSASVGKISSLADKLMQKAHYVGHYKLFKIIVDKLPKRFPSFVHEESAQALVSMDTNTRRLGQKSLLFLNMKTILTVVDSYFLEAIDTEKDRDEMVSAATISVLEKFSNLSPNLVVSQQVHVAARNGVTEYLASRDNMPTAWIRDAGNRKLIAEKIKEVLEEGVDNLTNERINNLSKELSKEIGVDEYVISDYLWYLKSFDKSDDKRLAAFEDITAGEASSKQLKSDMEKVLGTLTDREKRVIELRYGLEGHKPLTLEETSKEFGVTKERIRQIESKALRKLRYPTRARQLWGYLHEDKQIGYIGNTLERRKEVRLDAVDTNEIVKFLNPYSIEWFDVPEYVKEQLVQSGIREIGDFFSANPSEIAEGWTGNPLELAKIVRTLLNSLGSGDNSKGESDIRLLRHITNGILYREGIEIHSLSEEERITLYRKAYEELMSFFPQRSLKNKGAALIL